MCQGKTCVTLRVKVGRIGCAFDETDRPLHGLLILSSVKSFQDPGEMQFRQPESEGEVGMPSEAYQSTGRVHCSGSHTLPGYQSYYEVNTWKPWGGAASQPEFWSTALQSLSTHKCLRGQ